MKRLVCVTLLSISHVIISLEKIYLVIAHYISKLLVLLLMVLYLRGVYVCRYYLHISRDSSGFKFPGENAYNGVDRGNPVLRRTIPRFPLNYRGIVLSSLLLYY